jgi:GT2 family glycosyltransferase
MVDVGVEPGLFRVEGLGSVDVGDGNLNQLELPIHGRVTFELSEGDGPAGPFRAKATSSCGQCRPIASNIPIMATAPAARLAQPLEVPCDADPRVSLIVLAARRADLLAACLAALPAATAGGPPCETVIVVNGATPEVQSLVREDVAGARVVGSPVNLGVAGGANLGRGVARGDLLVILHDDAEPRPGWLGRLVAVADRHPEAGVVGSRLVYPDGTPQGAGGVVFANGDIAVVADDPPSSLIERPVDFCQSCALLVRARLWDSIGGLDEEFFPAYFVDVDLAMAAWQAGWSVFCALRAEVAHHRSASSPTEFVDFLVWRNGNRLRRKWAAAISQHVSHEKFEDAETRLALERARLLAAECRRAGAPTDVPQRSPLRDARGQSAPRAQQLEAEVRAAFRSHLARRRGFRGTCRRVLVSVEVRLRRMRTALATARSGQAR